MAGELGFQVTNTGTVDVDQDLTITNTGLTFDTAAGTLDVASGKTLTVSGGTTVFGTGTVLTGAGTVSLAGAGSSTWSHIPASCGTPVSRSAPGTNRPRLRADWRGTRPRGKQRTITPAIFLRE